MTASTVNPIRVKPLGNGEAAVYVETEGLGLVRTGAVRKIEDGSWKGMYRFMATRGLLSGLYVALDAKRGVCCEKGVEVTLKGVEVKDRARASITSSADDVFTEQHIIDRLGMLRGQIEERHIADEERLGHGSMSDTTHQMYGARSHLMEMLVQRGYDRITLLHFAWGNTEGWQR